VEIKRRASHRSPDAIENNSNMRLNSSQKEAVPEAPRAVHGGAQRWYSGQCRQVCVFLWGHRDITSTAGAYRVTQLVKVFRRFVQHFTHCGADRLWVCGRAIVEPAVRPQHVQHSASGSNRPARAKAFSSYAARSARNRRAEDQLSIGIARPALGEHLVR
jgi:hypothetical protein